MGSARSVFSRETTDIHSLSNNIMQLAMIGLCQVRGNVTERLIKGSHSVVVYDRSADTVNVVKRT